MILRNIPFKGFFLISRQGGEGHPLENAEAPQTLMPKISASFRSETHHKMSKAANLSHPDSEHFSSDTRLCQSRGRQWESKEGDKRSRTFFKRF